MMYSPHKQNKQGWFESTTTIQQYEKKETLVFTNTMSSPFVRIGLRVKECSPNKKTKYDNADNSAVADDTRSFTYSVSPFVGSLRLKETQKIVDQTRLKAFTDRFQTIDDAEQERIKNLEQHFDDAVQTTNPEWLEARTHRITGSVMGAICHANPYESKEDYLRKKVWPREMDARGKANCLYGNLNEPKAEQAFDAYMSTFLDEPDATTGLILRKYDIQNLGLYVCRKPGYAMLGMSPDGILYSTWEDPKDGTISKRIDLIEYKCPATWEKKVYTNDSIYPDEWLPKRFPPLLRAELGEYPPSDWLPERKRLPLPSYYNSQVQYGMELFGMSGIEMHCCWFVVYSPVRTAVTVVDRDRVHGKWLIDRARTFWNELYARNHVLKESGLLLQDEVVTG